MLRTDSEAALAAHLPQFADDEILMLDFPLVMQTRRVNDRAHVQRVNYLYTLSHPQDPLGPTPQPSIGVLLSAFNASSFIEMALSSLASQRVAANQVLIIDDGSIDDLSSHIRPWLDRFPNAVFLKTQSQGKARALNTLLPYVRTDFVLELDADDWLDPNAIGHIKHLVTDVEEDTVLIYGNFRTWRKRTTGDYELTGIRAGHQISTPRELLSYALPLGPRVYRTSSLRAEGGFPVPSFANGRLYEDVLAISNLMQRGEIQYHNFTVYNNLQHGRSITKQHQEQWDHFVRLYRDHFLRSPRQPQ
ncbi:glycosyltransferase family 2 protein [Alicyclobacillus fastidiosus]|uniref:Glycosyltransferase family 2 protein n=1 Tax=Alicyclobacillus fastidiosus TaxID=392011 RepID=A0ABY6ZG92_9BACL|nr:glycosyltransferase family A protein [Alicyclobacillus fastidiosus]WAH41135.1 glycosyltransferase family 2 protein [Alicyclobacillus fastidiosus]